ncbi:MAG: WYL domain-containing protein [Actinomycetota bacterium]|nr:WYL domain-containing protein [Actinomycetota bacterium]
MTRLERLINLVAALLETDRPIPRVQLQQRVPGYEGSDQSARRAFERDKDSLRSMGVPIAVEPLDPANPELGDGYRIRREQYELADPGLETDELAALHLAASAVRLEGAGGEEALWKLGGVPGEHGPDSPLAALPGGEHLPTLFAAMSDRRTVRFTYRGAERAVDPYWLTFANGRWYLGGNDHLRQEERRFRLDRIETPPAVGEAGAFERPAMARRPSPQPWRLGDEEEVEALLLVDAHQADWAVAQVGEASVRESRPDGSVVLSLPVSNREAFRSFALGFLDHAEVLGPPVLRRELLDWLESVPG